jgi:single-stranded DNA-binding protein
VRGDARLTREHLGPNRPVGLPAPQHRRRSRHAEPVYADLIVWEAHCKAAAEHLVKGQAVSCSGRLEPHQYATSSGDHRVALERHGVDIEYGAKPREPSDRGLGVSDAAEQAEDDIPF